MAKFKPLKNISLGKYGPLNLQTLRLPHKKMQEHGHVIGASKSGKTRLLASLYIQYLQAGYSVICIDPQGGLVKLILAYLLHMGYFDTPGAFERLTYLDFAGAEELGLFMPFNVLKQEVVGTNGQTRPVPAHQVASNILEACHRAWPELQQGAAVFDTLLPDALTLLHHNNYPLIALAPLLDDEKFRYELVEKEPDYFLVSNFRNNYDAFKKVDQQIYAGSVKRRARQLTQKPVLRYGLGQSGNLLNFTKIMNDNKSLLINLGGLDKDVMSLLGCLITTGLEQAALSRALLPEGTKFPTTILMADEFTLFSDKSEAGFANGLSLTRQFGLDWIMAHQTWGQFSARMKSAVQNAGWEAIFRAGPDDADYSAKYVSTFDPTVTKEEEETSEDTRALKGFLQLQEQTKLVSQEIRDLKRRHFKYRSPEGKVADLITLDLPDPPIDREALGEIKRYYLSHCFRPQEEIEKEIYPFTWGRLEKKPSALPAYASYLKDPDEDDSLDNT